MKRKYVSPRSAELYVVRDRMLASILPPRFTKTRFAKMIEKLQTGFIVAECRHSAPKMDKNAMAQNGSLKKRVIPVQRPYGGVY